MNRYHFYKHMLKMIKPVWLIWLVSLLVLAGCTDQKNHTELEQEKGVEEISLSQGQEENAAEFSLPRNFAAYIFPELVWEMGGELTPQDFLDMEALEKESLLPEEALQSISFFEAPGEVQLQTAGTYEVWLTDGTSRWLAHLTVQDTQPPIITVPEALEYPVGEPILYKKGVSVVDNSGEVLEVTVDTHAVFPNIPGQYPVYYSATDSSSNTGKAESMITILEGHKPTQEEVETLARDLLASIITEDMEPLQKAWAIYEWCYSNIRNAADAVKDDMLQAVYDGLHYKVGDCYTYFATSSYLLSICGIENLAVSRKSENATHYWSLVNMGGGWYHFDCSHQPERYQCFMQTDAQVQEYSETVRGQEGYYQFDQEDMPERATEIIYSGER